MQTILDYLLPSLETLGLWGYWVVAVLVFLQGFAPTSPLSPASILVVLAGGLSAHGAFDFWDMVWFVAVADILGAHISYRLGIGSRDWAARRHWLVSQQQLAKAQRLFDRIGPAAVLIGRFVPMGAFVPLLAGVAHMERTRFIVWNIIGGLAYAVAALSLGRAVGTALPAVSAAAGLVGVVGLVLVILIAVIWILLVQIRRVWPFLRSVLGSIAEAIAGNDDVKALVARHPRFFSFLANRLHGKRFSGLPTTVLAAAFAYFLTLYVSLTLDFLFQDTITAADQRLAALFYALRDPGLVRFFTWIAALGAWRGEVVIALVAAALLWLGGRGWQVPVLWLGLLGNGASVQLLKVLFDRPRPDAAVYIETSAAFPSGHAAVSVALYGMLAYILVRDRLAPLLWALLPTSAMVFLIGVSRLYLVEHYLSDVLNGYLVGALWVLAMIWVMEWRRQHRAAPPVNPRWTGVTRFGLGTLILGVGLGGLFLAVEDYKTALNSVPPPQVSMLSVPLAEAFRTGVIGAYTESIFGEKQEPVSIVLLAQNAAAVQAIFADAGWQPADPPGLKTLGRAAFAAWFGQPYATAPITPGFWQGRPHDFGFQQTTKSDTLRERHHARLWDARLQLDDGRRVFVGSASFDDRLKWGLTHHIEPNIDAERDYLGQTLVETKKATLIERLPLTTPILGENMTGDAFFTDGEALVIDVPEMP